MNDFNRRELQSLLWAVNYVRDRTTNCGDEMRALQNKIPKIIGKDCDHLFKLSASYHGKEENRYRCCKCFIAFEDKDE